MLPLTASDPPLLLTVVAFQRRGDQVVRSPARVVRRFHGCVLPCFLCCRANEGAAPSGFLHRLGHT